MKKYLIFLLSLLIGLSSFGNANLNIDEQVIRSFNSLFPNAEKIKWDETPDSYVVHFTDGGILSRIVYQKQSSLVNFTRYYFQDHLPYAIQIKLKRDYPDKKVTGVTEISAYSDRGKPLQVEYYLNLEDNKTLFNIKIKRNGKFTVIEKFKKAA